MENLKRILIYTLLILILFTLQTGIFERISLGGIVPNLFLILTVSAGLIKDDKTGMLIGLACGLLYDIFFMSVIGYHALIFVYIGYFCGYFHKYYIPGDIRLPLILISSADIIQSIIFYILFFLLNGEFNFGYYFVHVILAEFIYTLGISVILYPLVLVLEHKIIQVPLWSKKKDA